MTLGSIYVSSYKHEWKFQGHTNMRNHELPSVLSYHFTFFGISTKFYYDQIGEISIEWIQALEKDCFVFRYLAVLQETQVQFLYNQIIKSFCALAPHL